MQCGIFGDWNCDCIRNEPKCCSLPAQIDSLNGMNLTHKGADLRKILFKGLGRDGKDIKWNFKGGIKKTVSTNVTINGKLAVSYEDKSPFKIAFHISEAKRNLEKLGYPNMTYDRPTGMVFCIFKAGCHDLFMSALYLLNKVKNGTATESMKGGFVCSNREMFGISDYATAYITEGFGFFSSSVSGGMGIPQERGFPIIFSPDYKLNAQEKAVFKEYGFKPLEK